MSAELAHVMRGGVVESVHFGEVVVADTRGAVVYSLGEPERYTFYRSSAKPLQALNVILSGAAERFGYSEAEIAISCASHSGSAEHTAVVAGILERLGMSQSALQCGIHDPGDAEEGLRLAKTGQNPGPIHNNCSGKHAGMLASCLAVGADPATYLGIDHPVQQANLRNIALMGGIDVAAVRFGEDGCGAPTFAIPLRAIATSFARLAAHASGSEAVDAAAARISAAMRAYPHLVSSRGSFHEALMLSETLTLVVKGGAEGLFCCGLPEQGLGVAIKISDGSTRAQPPVLLGTLRRLGLPAPLTEGEMAQYVAPPVTNAHGHVCGEIVVV